MKELSPTGCKPGTIYRTIGLIGIFAAFAQISLGGFVRASGSGLGCPDWPLCHGEIIPTFEYHTIIEYSHRALGSILGLLVILLLASTLIFYRKNRWLLYWNISASMLVVLAGVLGGITVITELVWWVRLIHLAIAQCVIASLAVILWQAFEVKPPSTATYSSIGNWKNKIVISLTIVFSLMLTGSYMVGVGASTSCSTWPLCRNELFPSGMEYSIHMGHRYMAVISTLYLGYMSITFIKNSKNFPILRKAAHSVLGLMILQIVVGAFVVWSDFSLHMKSTHLSLATLIWIAVVFTALTLHSLSTTKPELKKLNSNELRNN